MFSINTFLKSIFVIYFISTTISYKVIPPDDEFTIPFYLRDQQQPQRLSFNEPFSVDPKIQQILQSGKNYNRLNLSRQPQMQSQLQSQDQNLNNNVNVKEEINKLSSSFTHIIKWPNFLKNNTNITLGSVSAVDFDNFGNIVVFHRSDRIWNQNTFNLKNEYTQQLLGPIKNNTLIAFNRKTGIVAYEWGSNLFYMPHGLTIDHEGNIWITDVALHQVMKFSSKNHVLQMTLGKAFEPGQGARFCKPTAVAVLETGDFFVADGYCNSRIVKYSKTGDVLLAWGKNSFQGISVGLAPPNFFAIPHALTLAKDLDLLCVADRENGRIQCFHTGNVTFHSQYHSPIIGDRIFSVAYSPNGGGQLFVINGPKSHTFIYNEIHGYVIDMKTKQVLSKFGPTETTIADDNNHNVRNIGTRQFANPHDIIVSEDGTEIYVADLDPARVYKFLKNDLVILETDMIFNNTSNNSTTMNNNNNNNNVKPTVTLDDPSGNGSQQTLTPTTKMEPSATALIVVALIVLFLILTFGLALLMSRRRNKGCTTAPCGKRNRRHAWDFPTVKSDGFKLGNLLDRKRGFEKLDQEASDEEPNVTTNMLSSAQFA